MRGWTLSATAFLLTACVHPVPFTQDAEHNWRQVKPSGSPRAVKVAGAGESLVFYEVSASSPLEVKATGPLKLHLQIRLRARPSVKGRIKLTAWTKVDDHPVVARALNVKISKKWRDGGRLTTRRIVRLRLPEGEHVVRFGLAADCVETALVRVVSRSPAEEK